MKKYGYIFALIGTNNCICKSQMVEDKAYGVCLFVFFFRPHEQSIYMSHKYEEVPHNFKSNNRKQDYSLDEFTPNYLLTSCTKAGKTLDRHK